MVDFKIWDVTDRTPIITIHILPSISRIKSNQTMKFGQLIKYDVEVHFFKYQAKNDAERLLSELLFFKSK